MNKFRVQQDIECDEILANIRMVKGPTEFESFIESLITAKDITPEVRFLLMYFKFHEKFGDVKTVHIVEDLKPFWGTTKISTTMKLALKSGYMTKEFIKCGKSTRSIKYHIDCEPSFKTHNLK